MSEVIGTFDLEHVCNTYTTDAENNITNHTNWKGSADGYGSIWGTLTFAPTPLGSMTEALEGGEVRWTGQGFLEDGTSVAGTGAGTWKKIQTGMSGIRIIFLKFLMAQRFALLGNSNFQL